MEEMIGAGGGGFLVFYVDKLRQEEVRKALSDFIEIPFKFENIGSEIIYFN